MKFLWTTLHVAKLEESVWFYTEIVGLAETRRMEYPDGKAIIFLGKGETQVELVYTPSEEVAMGESISLGFQVESVDDMIVLLEKNDIPVYSGPFEPTPFIKFFYVLDPNGLKVQFAQRKNDV
jgi:lactoylglutathione lyase